MADIFLTSVELGLLYALAVLGVFLTFRVLNFPDLTVDASSVTGAAVAALAIHAGMPGIFAALLGFVAGFIAGGLTAFLHNTLGISKILSGILSLSMLYTINLRLMDGPNISLLNQETITGFLKTPIDHWYAIVSLLIIVSTAKFLLDWFLQTEFGLRLRATGDNESTAASFGINTKVTKFVGVCVSNGLVGLAGAFVSQYQGFVDVNMGIGNIILGLAALMLGEAIMSGKRIWVITLSVIIGSILYQLIISMALRFGLPATDLKFVTAFIVVIALVLGTRRNQSYGR